MEQLASVVSSKRTPIPGFSPNFGRNAGRCLDMFLEMHLEREKTCGGRERLLTVSRGAGTLWRLSQCEAMVRRRDRQCGCRDLSCTSKQATGLHELLEVTSLILADRYGVAAKAKDIGLSGAFRPFVLRHS